MALTFMESPTSLLGRPSESQCAVTVRFRGNAMGELKKRKQSVNHCSDRPPSPHSTLHTGSKGLVWLRHDCRNMSSSRSVIWLAVTGKCCPHKTVEREVTHTKYSGLWLVLQGNWCYCLLWNVCPFYLITVQVYNGVYDWNHFTNSKLTKRITGKTAFVKCCNPRLCVFPWSHCVIMNCNEKCLIFFLSVCNIYYSDVVFLQCLSSTEIIKRIVSINLLFRCRNKPLLFLQDPANMSCPVG